MYEFILSFSRPETLAAYLVAAAVFGTLMTILLPYLQGNKLETRLKAVASQRERLRKQSRAALEKKGLRRKDDSVVGNISSTLNLAKALEDPNVVKLMNQAGMRGPGPISAFYFARMALPLVGAIGAFVYIFYVNDHGLNTVMKYGSLAFGAAAGFYAPNLYVSNLAQNRQKSLRLSAQHPRQHGDCNSQRRVERTQSICKASHPWLTLFRCPHDVHDFRVTGIHRQPIRVNHEHGVPVDGP